MSDLLWSGTLSNSEPNETHCIRFPLSSDFKAIIIPHGYEHFQSTTGETLPSTFTLNLFFHYIQSAPAVQPPKGSHVVPCSISLDLSNQTATIAPPNPGTHGALLILEGDFVNLSLAVYGNIKNKVKEETPAIVVSQVKQEEDIQTLKPLDIPALQHAVSDWRSYHQSRIAHKRPFSSGSNNSELSRPYKRPRLANGKGRSSKTLQAFVEEYHDDDQHELDDSSLTTLAKQLNQSLNDGSSPKLLQEGWKILGASLRICTTSLSAEMLDVLTAVVSRNDLQSYQKRAVASCVLASSRNIVIAYQLPVPSYTSEKARQMIQRRKALSQAIADIQNAMQDNQPYDIILHSAVDQMRQTPSIELDSHSLYEHLSPTLKYLVHDIDISSGQAFLFECLRHEQMAKVLTSIWSDVPLSEVLLSQEEEEEAFEWLGCMCWDVDATCSKVQLEYIVRKLASVLAEDSTLPLREAFRKVTNKPTLKSEATSSASLNCLLRNILLPFSHNYTSSQLAFKYSDILGSLADALKQFSLDYREDPVQTLHHFNTTKDPFDECHSPARSFAKLHVRLLAFTEIILKLEAKTKTDVEQVERLAVHISKMTHALMILFNDHQIPNYSEAACQSLLIVHALHSVYSSTSSLSYTVQRVQALTSKALHHLPPSSIVKTILAVSDQNSLPVREPSILLRTYLHNLPSHQQSEVLAQLKENSEPLLDLCLFSALRPIQPLIDCLQLLFEMDKKFIAALCKGLAAQIASEQGQQMAALKILLALSALETARTSAAKAIAKLHPKAVIPEETREAIKSVGESLQEKDKATSTTLLKLVEGATSPTPAYISLSDEYRWLHPSLIATQPISETLVKHYSQDEFRSVRISPLGTASPLPGSFRPPSVHVDSFATS